MHIIESMASVMRLKIGEPKLYPKFYPTPDKYITIQNDSHFPSRKYLWFKEVIDLLLPYLDKENIKVVQIGGAQDAKLPNCHINLAGQTSYRQSYHVVKNAMLHIGVDSLNVHIASVFGTKIVAIFSNMYKEQSGPYFSRPEDVRLLQAPLNGRKPSYSAQESPLCINLIRPEEIAQAALDLLEIKETIPRKSLYFGDSYYGAYLESVPDCVVQPDFMADTPLHIRVDYVNLNQTTESFLYNQINVRKSVIMTDKPLNYDILSKLKENVIQVVIKIKDETQLSIVKEIEKLGIPYVLLSDLAAEEIQKLKIHYMDHSPIQQHKVISRDKLPAMTPETQFKSSKILVSQNKNYASKAHWLAQEPSDGVLPIGKYFDNQDFRNETEFYYLFN